MPYNLRPRKRIKVEEKPKEKTEDRVATKVKKIKEKATKVEEKVNKVGEKATKVEEKVTKVEEKATKVEEKATKDEGKATKVKEKARRRQYTFGTDSCGELGTGKIGVSKKIPVCVTIDDNIKQVACGPMHTLSLTKDGRVYTYGCNDEGALGRVTDGDERLEATPTVVVSLENKITKVCAGDSHSAALTDKQEVFVWGNFRDEHGSVGLTPCCNGEPSYSPIQIMAGAKFIDIASGSNHMLLLDTSGTVYSFGVGAQGQLGRIGPDQLGEDCKITAENRELFLTPQKVSLKDVDPQRPFICDAIYAGNFCSFATNTDKKKNRLAGWGLNNYYQLGYKGSKGQLVQHFPRRSTFTCSTSMKGVACGQHHTLFLTKTGRVYAAGRHEYGMLGLGKVDKEVCPAKYVDSLSAPNIEISAGINTSFAVSDEGKLYSWGMGGINLGLQSEDDIKVPTEVTGLKDMKVVSVSAGGTFTSVLVE